MWKCLEECGTLLLVPVRLFPLIVTFTHLYVAMPLLICIIMMLACLLACLRL